MTTIKKLRRAEGLWLSYGDTDEECADKIQAIIGAYIDGYRVQRALRTRDNWHLLQEFPTDFGSYRYRILCEYCGGTGNAETELYEGLVNCPICTKEEEQ